MIIVGCILGLILCFYLLAIVCEDYFVSSLEKISEKLRLSEEVAGATFMAIGSSAPELFTSLIALTKTGNQNIGAGAIVGSAIFNILVIIGVSTLVATAYLRWQPVLRDLLFYIFSIIILLFTFYDGVIEMHEAAIYLGGYVVYLIVLGMWGRVAKVEPPPEEAEKEEEDEEEGEAVGGPLSGLMKNFFPNEDRYILVFAISIFFIGALSWALVEIAVVLAVEIGIPAVIIALTVLAAGTSIPDMLSSIIVARKGKGGMAVSNAVGSNTFDILIGLGLPWMLYILVTGNNFVVDTTNLLSSVFLLFSTVVALLMLFFLRRFQVGWWSGIVLIVLYMSYLGYAIWAANVPDPLGIESWLNSVVHG